MFNKWYFRFIQSKEFIYYLLTILLVLKLLAALMLELGNDEVYYTLYAKKLQWSYFDHPPMVGIAIFLTTLGGWFGDDFFVRLAPIVLASLGLVVIYRLMLRTFNKPIAITAAILWSSSIYLQIISGFFILPDTLLMFFVVLALNPIYSIYLSDDHSMKQWIMLGGALGLAMLSKYSIVFIVFGLFVYTLLYKRSLLRTKGPWISLLVLCICALPILFWNAQNGFASFQFHGKRVGMSEGIQWLSFLREFLGIVFYNNPFLVLLIAFFILLRYNKNWNVKVLVFSRIHLFMGLPIILFFLLSSLFKPTLPHWSAPGVSLLILPLSTVIFKRQEFVKYSLIFLLIVLALAPWLINYGCMKDNGNTQEIRVGRNDFTLDMYGWEQLSNEFEKLYSKRLLACSDQEKAAFVVDKWFPGGHIQFYLGQRMNWPTYGVGELEQLHQFVYFNESLPDIEQVDKLFYVTTSHFFTNPSDNPKFKNCQLLAKIPILRNGNIVANGFVYSIELSH